MHAVELFSAAVSDDKVPPYPEAPEDGVCCLTGAEGPTIARKHLLTKSFTDWSRLAAPGSDRVSIHVWRAWMYGWRAEGKARDYRPERMSAWWCDGKELRLIDRKTIRDLVLDPPTAEHWCGYATTSYKKHGTLVAPVNTSSQVWAWDDERVDVSGVHAVWERLREARVSGVPRPVLESLEPNRWAIQALGYAGWIEFERWARPLYQSALYRFCCYLLPSKEEIDAGQPAPEGQLALV